MRDDGIAIRIARDLRSGCFFVGWRRGGRVLGRRRGGAASRCFIHRTPPANPAATKMTKRIARFTVSPAWLAPPGLAPDRARLRAGAARRLPARRGPGAVWSGRLPRPVRWWPAPSCGRQHVQAVRGAGLELLLHDSCCFRCVSQPAPRAPRLASSRATWIHRHRAVDLGDHLGLQGLETRRRAASGAPPPGRWGPGCGSAAAAPRRTPRRPPLLQALVILVAGVQMDVGILLGDLDLQGRLAGGVIGQRGQHVRAPLQARAGGPCSAVRSAAAAGGARSNSKSSPSSATAESPARRPRGRGLRPAVVARRANPARCANERQARRVEFDAGEGACLQLVRMRLSRSSRDAAWRAAGPPAAGRRQNQAGRRAVGCAPARRRRRC